MKASSRETENIVSTNVGENERFSERFLERRAEKETRKRLAKQFLFFPLFSFVFSGFRRLVCVTTTARRFKKRLKICASGDTHTSDAVRTLLADESGNNDDDDDENGERKREPYDETIWNSRRCLVDILRE